MSLLETIHTSSGSSGVPTFWARSQCDEIGTATRFEQIFKDNFNSDRVRVRGMKLQVLLVHLNFY